MRPLLVVGCLAGILVGGSSAGVSLAANLPVHRPLRVLIVSDEVNPHGLAPEELTQPGELSAALALASSGLRFDAGPDPLLEIATDQIEQATAALLRPHHDPLAYDVLVYFAHRIPAGPEGGDRQEAFAAAVETFVIRGGGVVSFHHGIYLTPGKESIQQLLGGTATGAVVWSTGEGQRVISVSPLHFVACNELDPEPLVRYEDAGRGVPDDDYPFFTNVPDERYLSFELNPSATDVEILFASNYDQSGTTHLLGFTNRRPGWRGAVVVYQPGEYEPSALDPAGPNLQILVNAIVWSTHRVPRDGLGLRVNRGLVPEAVVLDWNDCPTLVEVRRSFDPALIDAPGSLVGHSADGNWLDTPPPGEIVYYRVLRD